MEAAVTVGRFTFQNGTLSGPQEYMRERGNTLADRIVAGDDPMFNMTAHLSPTVECALLVRLQTDYAGWLGMRETLASLQRS